MLSDSPANPFLPHPAPRQPARENLDLKQEHSLWRLWTPEHPGPPQPRGELAGRGAHGDLLLTLHCPESKRLPMRKARRGTTFAFRAEGERGWTSCSITSPPRAQPQMTCKSQPSPSASGHGTLQEPLLKPICSILPLALTLADTWPGTLF